jgi:putative spermidine/putrescine transport system substrate-binding protein
MQYGPINVKAFEYIDPAVAAGLPTAPAYKDMTWIPNAEYWAEHDKEITERWKQWMLE